MWTVDRGYARISLDRASSGSIAKQRTRISEYAGGQPEFYVDESVSGSKVPFAERAQGARLLLDLRRGDRVLVTKIDRAARNVRDLLDLVQQVEAVGASVVFIDQQIDTSGPMGRFVLVLLAAIAELEANIIAERRKESLEAFRSDGRHAVGRVPFGFVSVPREDGRGLVVRPEWTVRKGYERSPAEMVRQAVDRVMAGEPQNLVRKSLDQRASVSIMDRYEKKVAEALIEQKATPPAPNPLMSKSGFHKLLYNPRLAGMSPDGEGVVTLDGSPRVDQDAALLTMAEWDALRDYLATADAKTWSRREGYGSVLACATCGTRLYMNVSTRTNKSTGAPLDTYSCNRANHVPGQPGAASVMVHKADVYLEQTFLARFGERRALRAVTVSSSASRAEALSAAKVALLEAQRRYVSAPDEEAEALAMDHMAASKRAVRVAESMPDESTVTTEDTERTVAEHWNAADVLGRAWLLSRAGTWKVHPGRLSIEQKITLEEDDLLTELLTYPLGSDSPTYVDSGAYLI